MVNLYIFVNVWHTKTDMKLILGLGNPEEKYRSTRHNVGFRILSHYALGNGITFQMKDKFKALVAEITHDGEKILLAKPTTYYNMSGEAARSITDFYKIAPEDVLIVHDELALPLGTIRTRRGGSDAGNNGIKSISTHLGPETARIRVGVYNELRDSMDDADFVLGRFSKEESDQLVTITKKATDLIDSFISGSFEHTTHS